MGRFFGKRWKIDGVTAGPISRHYPANGRYSVIFERDDAFLEQIEKINWAKPTMQRLSEDANEQGLPEGYGFMLVLSEYGQVGPPRRRRDLRERKGSQLRAACRK